MFSGKNNGAKTFYQLKKGAKTIIHVTNNLLFRFRVNQEISNKYMMDKAKKTVRRFLLHHCTTHFIFIGNSIFYLSLELQTKFWKTSLKVVYNSCQLLTFIVDFYTIMQKITCFERKSPI